MKWKSKIKFVEQAIQYGNLDKAVRCYDRGLIRNKRKKLAVAREVAGTLLNRATLSISSGQFYMAWLDLDEVTKLNLQEFAKETREKKNQLIELTIESADASLVRGEPVCALNCIEVLERRQVRDWRLNQIKAVSECLSAASRFAAQGQFKKSVAELEKAGAVRPDLPYLAPRISALKKRQRQMKKYITDVEAFALQWKWGDVSQSCEKILHIAPTNQFAFEARRDCKARLKKKTRRQMDSTTAGAGTVPSDSAFNANRQTGHIEKNVVVEKGAFDRIGRMDKQNSGDRFLIWVDGVGGYLVCGRRVNALGQAINRSQVDIGIQGNLRSHHANFERVQGGHVLEPIGKLSVDGVELDSKFVLKNGQILAFEGGVELAYCQTHALSKTARLDFVSRHRSVPWADAIILPVNSIILGPNRFNHVVCPAWGENLVLFERSGKWFCRSPQAMEVDGKLVTAEAPIEFDSRIVGDDFSLTLEPV